MLYLSILFIISGILLFVYSIINSSDGSEKKKPFVKKTKRKIPSEPEKENTDNTIEINDESIADKRIVPHYLYSDENDVSDHHDPEENSLSEPEDDFFFFDDAETTEFSDQEFNKLKEDIESGNDTDIDFKETASPQEYFDEDPETDNIDRNGSSNFTLYNDTSSLIDYRTSSGNIDPTITKYKNISRVGRGRLILDRDGINFNMEKKHFRFDFHKIHELFSGENYLAFFIKGSDTAKLFITDKETDIINKIEESYKDLIGKQS